MKKSVTGEVLHSKQGNQFFFCNSQTVLSDIVLVVLFSPPSSKWSKKGADPVDFLSVAIFHFELWSPDVHRMGS